MKTDINKFVKFSIIHQMLFLPGISFYISIPKFHVQILN